MLCFVLQIYCKVTKANEGVEDETPIFGLNLKADTQMAPATNWLSFSLMSPMEMLRSSSESESPFAQAYDTSAATVASPHYFLDNFYANGNGDGSLL